MTRSDASGRPVPLVRFILSRPRLALGRRYPPYKKELARNRVRASSANLGATSN